jgi:hypothetical protein
VLNIIARLEADWSNLFLPDSHRPSRFPMLSPIFITLAFISGAIAAIGPEADLFIVNEHVSPDGFHRP